MQTKTKEVNKAEIIKMLQQARQGISDLIPAVESDRNWKDIHQDISRAIIQISAATRMLAKYHLIVCMLKKHQDTKIPLVREDIDEIIKTYRYLN